MGKRECISNRTETAKKKTNDTPTTLSLTHCVWLQNITDLFFIRHLFSDFHFEKWMGKISHLKVKQVIKFSIEKINFVRFGYLNFSQNLWNVLCERNYIKKT